MKLLQQCFLFSIVVVIPGHNLGNSQVSVNRTIGPTLVFILLIDLLSFVESIVVEQGTIYLSMNSEINIQC